MSCLYSKQEWSLVSISRPSTCLLTVTLLYHPTITLYAWPFNLSGTDSKGTCYITPDASIEPHEQALSISLRVLTDVVRCWIKSRQPRRRASSESIKSTSSLDSLIARAHGLEHQDDAVGEITATLGLRTVEKEKRRQYLLRQHLPVVHSPASSDTGSDSSSPATTPSCSPKETFKKLSLNTKSSQKLEDNRSSVPQIRLVEPTPLDRDYTERTKVLGPHHPEAVKEEEAVVIPIHPCDRIEPEAVCNPNPRR